MFKILKDCIKEFIQFDTALKKWDKNKKILKISKPAIPSFGIVSGPCYRVYKDGSYKLLTEEEIKGLFKPNEIIVAKSSDCEKLRTTSEFNKNIKEFCSGNLGESWFNKEGDK